MNNPYDTLGVPPNATGDEIKSAFRKAAADAHPDAGGDEERMKDISGAYMVLKDPARRKNYDQTGRDRVSDEKSLILQEATKIFLQVIAKVDDVETINILDACKKVVKTNIDEGDRHINKRKDDIEKKGRALDRLTKKDDDSPNVFQVAIEESIKAQRNAIAGNEDQMAMLKAVAEYFDGYQYEADIVTPMSHPGTYQMPDDMSLDSMFANMYRRG